MKAEILTGNRDNVHHVSEARLCDIIGIASQSSGRYRKLTLNYSYSSLNPFIIPEPLSDVLDLSVNDFSDAVVHQWGDYYVFACKGITNGEPDAANDVVYVYNTLTQIFDKTDYRATVFANYGNGALLAGDSISPNLLQLFSGFDDLGYNINNYVTIAPTRLGSEGMKRLNRFVVRGLIAPAQTLEIWLSFDGGSFVKYGQVVGNGQYVNSGSPVEVGGQTVGNEVVGSGGTVTAFPYEAELAIGSDLFERVSVKFVASGVGYTEIDSFVFKDIRDKGRRILAQNSQ